MQLPRARSDLFMQAPSCIRIPVFCVLLARSDPARSIRENLACLIIETLSYLSLSYLLQIIYRIA